MTCQKCGVKLDSMIWSLCPRCYALELDELSRDAGTEQLVPELEFPDDELYFTVESIEAMQVEVLG